MPQAMNKVPCSILVGKQWTLLKKIIYLNDMILSQDITPEKEN